MDDTQTMSAVPEQPAPPAPVVLQAISLGIQNPTGWAIRSRDLTLVAGTVVGLTGPVGAGHTRVLLALGGRYRPDEGQVHLPGGPAVIGWFPDLDLLDDELTVSENLAESLAAIGTDRTVVPDALRLVGIQGLADLRVAALTCEQKVMLGLAWCSQSTNPVVVIEATCAGSSESAVWTAARTLADLGRVVLVGTTLTAPPADAVIELGPEPESGPDDGPAPTGKPEPDAQLPTEEESA